MFAAIIETLLACSLGNNALLACRPQESQQQEARSARGAGQPAAAASSPANNERYASLLAELERLRQAKAMVEESQARVVNHVFYSLYGCGYCLRRLCMFECVLKVGVRCMER